MPDRDVLSHEEIDALLSNVDNDDAGDEAGNDKRARSYDLSAKTAPRHGRLPVLEMIGERFARSARKNLQNLLRQAVDVGAAGIESHTFEGYSKTIKVPASISIIELAPISGHCLLVLSADLVDRIVDRFFGGFGEDVPAIQGSREFTPTERRVISRLRELLAADLCAAWQDILALQYRLHTEESNPHLVNVYAHDDELLVVSYPIGFCGVDGQMSVVMPHAGLEPYLGLLGAAGRQEDGADDPTWRATLEALLLDTELHAHCCVASQQVRLIDLMNLAPGDVLNVDIPATHELLVDSVPVMQGRLQESEGKLIIEHQGSA